MPQTKDRTLRSNWYSTAQARQNMSKDTGVIPSAGRLPFYPTFLRPAISYAAGAAITKDQNAQMCLPASYYTKTTQATQQTNKRRAGSPSTLFALPHSYSPIIGGRGASLVFREISKEAPKTLRRQSPCRPPSANLP